MTATLRLPRMLSDAANAPTTQTVEGHTVRAVLDEMFRSRPGLRNHIIDDSGEIRPHVSVFVNGRQAALSTEVGDGAEVRILHAVSGG